MSTPMSSGLADWQTNALIVTERVNSGVSLAGILFVLSTYLFFPAFNKPINRLIFFATWANLGVSVAALISVDGPNSYTESNKTLCRFQAFLVQMFLGVDAYWALCMAINVHLAFFRGYTIEQLRALDVRYLIACYGLSFAPAFAFIFVNTSERGDIYGPATIWCWISKGWDFLRLVVLYAIVWVALLLSLIVYVMAARVIWKKRAQLDGFLNPWNESPFSNVITTEIRITHEDKADVNGAQTTEGEPVGLAADAEERAYSVNIEVGSPPTQSMPAILNVRGVTRNIAANESNAEAWLYARVAFLFFFALAITWVPSSINRIYDVLNPNTPNFGLSYASSFVFPLQGFWNVIVYIVTSRTACKNLWHSLRGRGNIAANMRAGRPIKIESPRRRSFGSRGRDPRIPYDDEGELIKMKNMGSGRQRFGSQDSSVAALTGAESGRSR